MGWMKPRCAPRNRFSSSRQRGKASRWIPKRPCTSSSSLHNVFFEGEGNVMRRICLSVLGCVLLIPCWAVAQQAQNEPPGFPAVVERIATREKANLLVLRRYAPLAETYIQRLKPDADLGAIPTGDDYFLGRLNFSDGYPEDRSFMPEPGFGSKFLRTLTGIYKLHFLPLG